MDAAAHVPDSLHDALEHAFQEAVRQAAEHQLIKHQAQPLKISREELIEKLTAEKAQHMAAVTGKIESLRALYRRRSRLIERSRNQPRNGPLSRLGVDSSGRPRSPHLITITPNWRDIDKSIRAAIESLQFAFVEQAMIPSLRLWFNRERQKQAKQDWNYRRRLDEDVDTAELRSPVTRWSFVRTERLETLGQLLGRMPGGSIGVAGPRGSGKTTALRNVELVMAAAQKRFQLFQVHVSAPVEYVPREFLLFLHDVICTSWLDRQGVSPTAGQPPEEGERLRRLWAMATVALPVVLAGAGIAVWLTGLATVGLQGLGGALPLVLALVGVAVAAGLGIWMGRRLNFEEKFSYPYFDQPQTYFSFRIRILPTSTATKYALLIGSSVALLSALALLYASGRLEWLNAQVASGLALLVVAVSSFLSGLIIALRTTLRTPASVTKFSKIFVLTAVMAVSLSLGVQGLGLLVAQPEDSVVALVFGGTLLAAAGSLVGLRTIPPAAISGDTGITPESVTMALRDRRRLRYQRTKASGWTAGTKVGAGSYLPFAVELDRSGTVSEVEHPLTVPEITQRMEKLLTEIRRENPGDDFRIVICIDELDKLEGEEGAKTFLNEIKGVFTISDVLFVVSVSEDAMASFEQRGLAFRDVFDSAFDEIIHVHQLSMAETVTLVGKRISNVPKPFVALAHCLSAGLARDVIRALDHMTEAAAPQDLTRVTKTVVHREIRGKWQAVVSAVRPIPLEPQVTEVLKALFVIDRCPGADSVEGRCLMRDDAFDQSSALELPMPDSPELEQFRTLQRLAGEYLGFTYFCRTLIELFNFDQEETLNQFIDAEKADGSERHSIDYLAGARQHLGVNPRLAWEEISFFRELHQMSTLEFPAALLGSPR
ncbi:MAG: P-loop NTPase fold protein [Actinomycetota bacterium]